MCRYWDPGCENPLINAIRAQSGYPLSWFEVWQALFLRFRSGLSFDLTDYEPTRAGTLTAIEVDTAQTDCITEEEVEKRTRKYFWKGSEGPYFRNRYTEAVHPLVLAASLPSTKIIDQLLTTNADRSFWMAFPALKAIPEQPTPSSLALSSPPHEPIASGNIEMLTYLLQAGFNPNILPLGDVCTRMTPFMATILDCVSWNEPAYEILARDPRIDFNIPAGHSLEALRRVEDTPLAVAGATAYGHTLLHIACMPLMIQNLASNTRESILNIRWPH
ncbi:hypothetical protein N7486_009331 [Penicillium sp. IBT 16267x]|nr:hypothetical protein N7486_009331 [Penicillium sp. IBT 16267x]